MLCYSPAKLLRTSAETIVCHINYSIGLTLLNVNQGTTICFTPSGGGPDPNDCHIIADALRFQSQNIAPVFTVTNGVSILYVLAIVLNILNISAIDKQHFIPELLHLYFVLLESSYNTLELLSHGFRECIHICKNVTKS